MAELGELPGHTEKRREHPAERGIRWKRFTKAREAMQRHTRKLHLMARALMSPKVAAITGKGEKFQKCGCIWEGCREVTPDQDHIMWRCTKRPAGAPKRPKDQLQERLG